LNLAYNKFEFLPDGLENLENLKILDLEGNPISDKKKLIIKKKLPKVFVKFEKI